MKRKLTITLTIACTLAIGATAWASSFSDAEYQGRVASDHGTFFGFDLKKQGGVTKLTRVKAYVSVKCSDGTSGPIPFTPKGSLRVRHRAFSGTLKQRFTETRGGSSPAKGQMKISGRLQEHGKATGEMDVSFDFTPSPVAHRSGLGRVHCHSKTLDWKAKRGAVVSPTVALRPAGRPR